MIDATGAERVTRVCCGAGLAGLLAAQVGCGPSPQPLPPPADIAIQALSVAEEPGGDIRIAGAPGAVQGGDFVEVGVLVETPFLGGLFQAPVGADGSFSLVVDASLSDIFRLQPFGPGGSAGPVEVTTDPGDPTVLITPPQVDCLVATPAFEVALPATPIGIETSAPIVFRNDCTTVVGLDGFTEAANGWSLVPQGFAPPFDLLSGEQATVEVRFTPAQSGAQSSLGGVLIVDVGESELRPFTLRGEGQ